LNIKLDSDTSPWTFSGARHAQLVDSLRSSTATDRVAVLEQLLDLAESSGALAKTRAREEADWRSIWSR